MELRFGKLLSIPAATAALLVGAGAFAAPVPEATETAQLPEVVVEAGATDRTVVGRAAATGAPIERTTVDYHVRYADLDLAKHAHVQTLHERIDAAARAACEKLDQLSPLQQSHRQTRGCIEEAIRGAAPQVQQVIADAQDTTAHNSVAAALR